MNSIKALLLALILLFVPTHAFARWAKFEEAKRTYKVDTEEVEIKKDGTFVREYRRMYSVNSEAARQEQSVLDFEYNAALETFELLDVAVINGKERIPVPKHLISETAATGDSKGLDQTRTLKIALPNVVVGSVIDFRVRRVRTHPQLSGVYNDTFNFGYYATLKGASVRIRSELPLRYKIHGPQGYVDLKEKQTGGFFTYEFTLNKDAYFQTTNESNHPNWFAEPEYPYIQITSLQSWDALVTHLRPKMEEELAAPLPKRYEKILSKTRKLKSFNEKMDALTQGINEELRYLGDWRTSESHFFPKSLKETSERGFGDCKDFALILTKLARSIGLKAHLALVYRGDRMFEPRELPMTIYFNHMITRIEDENGKAHWIDPTNILSDSSHIGRDIAGRPALALFENSKQTEMTPSESFEKNKGFVTSEFKHLSNGRLLADMKMVIEGEPARNFVQRVSRKSERQKKELILNIFSAGRQMVSGEAAMEDIPKGLLRPVKLGGRVEIMDAAIETTAGWGIPVSRDFETHLDFSVEGMVSGVQIGELETVTFQTTYKDVQLVGALPEDCTVDSPWLSVTRKYKSTGKSISLERVQVTKQPYISNAELKSEAFANLRKQLRSCARDRMLIYKKLNE